MKEGKNFPVNVEQIRQKFKPCINICRDAVMKVKTPSGIKHSQQDKEIGSWFKEIGSRGENIETSTHFLLHCSNYSNERLSFLNIIRNIDSNNLSKNDLKVTETLLYGDSSYDDTNNTLIMNATMEFLFASKRFDVPCLGRMWLYC